MDSSNSRSRPIEIRNKKEKPESSVSPHFINMLHIKPIRESLSFKQNEKHLLDSRDALCQHYRLNKSDLVKYLIKKESFSLKNPQGTFL
jgi:hypothetical protein